MENLTLDKILGFMIIIFGVVLLIIPLFYGLQNKIEIKDKKGKLLRVDLRGLNVKGKFYIIICLLSLVAGIWKAFREDNAKTIYMSSFNDSRDTINLLNKKVDRFKSLQMIQFKLDSAALRKYYLSDSLLWINVQTELHKKGIGLDKNYHVIGISTEAPLIQFGANASDIHLEKVSLSREQMK